MYNIKPVRKTPPNHLLPFLERWQSNNNPKDLGIVRFIFDLYELNRRKGFPPLIRDFKPQWGVAPWAAEALHEYFIYEPGMTKEDRCHVFATYRDGTKTTWFSFALPLYEVYVGQYGIYFNQHLVPEVDYQVLKGKTGKEAKKRLLNLSHFIGRPLIKHMFGNLKPSFKDVKEKEGKDEASLLMLTNNYMFEASGIEQPVRGFNLLQVRPKKITFDDPENKDNVKTEERRKNNRAEVMEESFGAVSDDGCIIYIGNKVHADDTIGKLLDEKNTQWKKQFHTLTYTPGPNGTKLPGVGNLDIELPDWAARDTIEKIRRRLDWFEKQPELGGLKGFLKEYYNIIKSDAEFKLKDFHGRYERKFGNNWLVVSTEKGEEWRNVNIFIGCDPAISEQKLSSDAVVSVVAVDSYNRRYVLDVAKGKFDINDRFKDDYDFKGVVALKPEEISNIIRIGSADEVTRKFIFYNAMGIAIEVYGQQLTFFNEAQVKINKLGKRPIMLPYNGGAQSKTTRIRQQPLAFFESGLYHIKDDLKEKNALKVEVNTFPYSGLHILDSLHILEQIISPPKRIEYDALGNFLLEEKKKQESFSKVEENVESWIVS